MRDRKTTQTSQPQYAQGALPVPGPVKVSDLMGKDPVIELDHDGQIYRLRITRNRKLILTK